TNDTTPPSKLTLDAHVPQPSGQDTIVTVTPTGGAKSITLTNLPEITLIAAAEDPERAIAHLAISGQTVVVCRGTDGKRQTVRWLKSAPPAVQPQFSRLVSLPVRLGRQAPTDHFSDFIAHCDPGLTVSSVDGDFSATTTNGAAQPKSLKTATFHFGWTRPP